MRGEHDGTTLVTVSASLQMAEEELKTVRQQLRQCKQSFDSLVKFFGENPGALANDAVFWVDVISFVNRFTACQREVFMQAQVKLNSALSNDNVGLHRNCCELF